MRLNKLNLDVLYGKAKNAFWECASNQEAEIFEETGVSFNSIRLKRNSVCVKFSGVDTDSYIIETKLELFRENGEYMGWYCLHEDHHENVVDDFLVFE